MLDLSVLRQRTVVFNGTLPFDQTDFQIPLTGGTGESPALGDTSRCTSPTPPEP